jgi:hypothetical protein
MLAELLVGLVVGIIALLIFKLFKLVKGAVNNKD